LSRRSPLALAAALLLMIGLLPSTVGAASIWRYNLYRSSGLVFQDPYYTACTAAVAMMMLNFTDLADTGGAGFRWTSYRTKNSSDPKNLRDMTSILSFERAHDTLAVGSAGSDAHGWRNALNFYGWGTAAMTDQSRRVYDDRAYGSFDSALKGIVRSIARYRKPVGLLAWAGQHAQVATGYVVTGEDPATSTNFTVNGLYVTDPLQGKAVVNLYINRLSLMSGSLKYRFQAYRETDSPLDDGYTAGFRKSSIASTTSEWWHRWVVVQPIQPGLPDPTPTPTPTPTPAPSSDPTPSASASASASATSSQVVGTASTPAAETVATPPPTPSPTPPSTPDPTPTEPPTAPPASIP
jgi:hypothetical protein